MPIHSRVTTHVVAVSALLLMLAIPQWTMATESSDAANVLIQQRQLGGGMMALADSVAKRTITCAGIEKAVGASRAQSLVAAELRKLQPKYQPEWDQNLALVYADVFTADELRSLAAEGNSSRSFAKLTQRQDEIS